MIIDPNKPEETSQQIDMKKAAADQARRLLDRIVADRNRWLNKNMKKLLPNNIWAKMRKGRFDDEVNDYIKAEDVELKFENLGVTILIAGEEKASWTPAFKFLKPAKVEPPLIIAPNSQIILP